MFGFVMHTAVSCTISASLQGSCSCCVAGRMQNMRLRQVMQDVIIDLAPSAAADHDTSSTQRVLWKRLLAS